MLVVESQNKSIKIISIEGLDSAGKETAANVLYNYFSNKGLIVERYSCPNYDSPIGRVIHDIDAGLLDSDAKTLELLHAVDKQYVQSYIHGCEVRGVDVLLIDRYVHSLWAYGSYEHDKAWLQELTRYMRKPDAVFYLDVEPEVSMHRAGHYACDLIPNGYDERVTELRHVRDAYVSMFNQVFDSASDLFIANIDANLPRPVARVILLEKASELYTRFTGLKERV